MSLNYAIRDIVMDHGHNFHNTGIDVYRGRSYNTDFAILSSSTSDGLIQFRTVPAREGGFYQEMLSRDTEHWTHGYKQNPDVILSARDESFFLRAELKSPGDQPNVRCWNAPFRKEVLKDVNQHVIHDNNTCLFMVMSEMAYRRSRGEPWEDSSAYRERLRGGEPPVGHTIPFPTIEGLLAMGASNHPVEGTISWRWFCQRTPNCIHERCVCKSTEYEPEEIDEENSIELRALYRLYPQTALVPREFTRGTDSYEKVGNRFQCTVCEFTGRAVDIENHYRDAHAHLRITRVPEYRLVVAITQNE